MDQVGHDSCAYSLSLSAIRVFILVVEFSLLSDSAEAN